MDFKLSRTRDGGLRIVQESNWFEDGDDKVVLETETDYGVLMIRCHDKYANLTNLASLVQTALDAIKERHTVTLVLAHDVDWGFVPAPKG